MEYTPLQNEILRTLSFLEPMGLEFILLDMDKKFLDSNPDLTTADLKADLKFLASQKKIKELKIKGQIFWIKVFPKKKWYHPFR